MNDWKAEQGGDWLRVKGIVFKVGTVFRLSGGIVFRLFNQTSSQSQRILSSPFLKDQFQTRLSDLQESSEHLLSQCCNYLETQFYSKIFWIWQKGPSSGFHKCVNVWYPTKYRMQTTKFKIYIIYSIKVFGEILSFLGVPKSTWSPAFHFFGVVWSRREQIYICRWLLFQYWFVVRQTWDNKKMHKRREKLLYILF